MISVLVADDHGLIRAGIEASLKDSQFHIVAAVGSGEAALSEIENLDPAIVVLDIEMPGTTGLQVLKALRDNADKRAVIMLVDTITDRQLLEVMRAGVQGIVCKSGEAETLLEALENVSQGQNAINESLLQRALDLSLHPRDARPMDRLSPREQRIARLVAQGLKNREVGAELGIGEGTIKVYLHAIYQKLGIVNRTALAMLAAQAQSD